MSKFSKLDLSILISNVIDHFDSALYGFCAPIIAPLFFPNNDPLISIILAYSVFATSIITRPIGAVVFGIIAKKHGPIRSLSYSLIGVALTTIVIGLIPTYSTIGIMAPILLIIFRALGGVFCAGEVTIASLYIVQNKEAKNAIKSSSYYQMSSMFGIIVASQITASLISFDLTEYWRVPFIVGGIAAFAGYYIRRYDNKKAVNKTQKMLAMYSFENLKIIWHNKKILLQISIVSSFSYMTYSVPFILMNSLIPLITDISLVQMMEINSYLLIFDLVIFPIIGNIMKNISALKILIISSLVMLISIMPIWYFLAGSTIFYVSCVRVWIIIIGVTFACPINIWQSNLIPNEEKYLITGIGSALGSAIIGKMIPAFCLGLYHYTGNHMSIALYIALISALVLFIIAKMRIK